MATSASILTQLIKDDNGQATVEAAVSLPVIFVLLLMLIQPSIVLFDRTVMQQAAAEGCRVLMTSDGSNGSLKLCEDYIRRRLSAIPQQDNFHVHAEECSWNITLSGSSGSPETAVVISTEVKPLPLLDAAAALLDATNERGNIVIEVETRMTAQPAWFLNSGLGSGAASWIGAWMNDK
ncbi:MAG: pilus assembly protein [Eggerthellaceae bacterium]|nr:pilus assembly protein [Eggerthellaceae bacterium]